MQGGEEEGGEWAVRERRFPPSREPLTAPPHVPPPSSMCPTTHPGTGA